ncbi:MAG: sulfite exporter TauE/SafE family protein [Cycloclasticus sp.]
MSESAFYIAFIIGFLGSTHCVPMCGGIVGILSSKGESSDHLAPVNALSVSLSYNAGRILSYSFIGLLAGAVGQVTMAPFDDDSLILFSRIITSIFMLAFGFYLLGWLNFLSYLERSGQRLWKHISPISRRILPIQNKRGAFYLGLIWGWLPCGLVYSALAWSLASTQPISGALIMLCFGLGTLPMLLAMGVFSKKLVQLRNSAIVRRTSGSLIIAFAIVNLINPSWLHHGLH